MDLRTKLERLQAYARGLGLEITDWSAEKRRHTYYSEAFGSETRINLNMMENNRITAKGHNPDGALIDDLHEAVTNVQTVLLQHGCDGDVDFAFNKDALAKIEREMATRGAVRQGMSVIQFYGPGGISKFDSRDRIANLQYKSQETARPEKDDIPTLLEKIRALQAANPPKNRKVIEQQIPEWEKKLRAI